MLRSRIFWVLLTLQHLLDQGKPAPKVSREGLDHRKMPGSDLCCLGSCGPGYRQRSFPQHWRNQRSWQIRDSTGQGSGCMWG